MKCFNHRELDAIAVCKHCGKAVCSQCLADTGGGIACRGDCEVFVRRSFEQQGELFRSSKVGYFGLAAFLASAGVGFLFFSFPGGHYERMLTPFMGLLATIFFCCAVHMYRIAKRMDQVR